MGVPTSEVGYISATTGRGDHEVHKGHVVALEKKHTVSCRSFTYAYATMMRWYCKGTTKMF
jgi:hypothetical protein